MISNPHIMVKFCICCDANGMLWANNISGTPWMEYGDYSNVITEYAVLSCSLKANGNFKK